MCVTIIMGASGSGKSTSMRNLNPEDVLLIQVIKKSLPFKSKGWSYRTKDNPTGNIFVTDDANTIIKLMHGTKKKIIVIDDLQYLMANAFMRMSDVKGFDKFTVMAKDIWNVMNSANRLPEDVRLYINWHTAVGDDGITRPKTIGKLLDDKIVLEGFVSCVLHTGVVDGKYTFRTNSSGNDVAKSPIGMFEQIIDNDLAFVDRAITDYYGITQPEASVAAE